MLQFNDVVDPHVWISISMDEIEDSPITIEDVLLLIEEEEQTFKIPTFHCLSNMEMSIEGIVLNSRQTNEEKTWDEVGMDDLELADIGDKNTQLTGYRNVESRDDTNFNLHLLEALEVNKRQDIIKDEDLKVAKQNVTMDIDAVELSVDIFDEPEQIKHVEDLDVIQNTLPKWNVMSRKNVSATHQFNKGVFTHVESVLDHFQLSKQVQSMTTEPYPQCSFNEHDGVDIVKLSKKRKVWELEGVLKPPNVPLSTTTLYSNENSLVAATNLKKYKDSFIYLDYEFQKNVSANEKTSKADGRSSGYIGQFVGNLNVNKDEYERSTKKPKSMFGIEKVNAMKQEDSTFISKNIENVVQNFEKEKTKVIVTSLSTKGKSNEMGRDLELVLEPTKIQHKRKEDNKTCNVATQSSEALLDGNVKDDGTKDINVGTTSKKKKTRRRSGTLSQEIMEQANRKRVRSLRHHVQVSTYDESLLDATIEKHIRTTSARAQQRKKKLINFEKTFDAEAIMVAAIGFPRESLTEEEVEAGVVNTVGSQEQANYIVVRNHILAKWRENVNAYLEQSTIMESVRVPHHKSLVAPAYKFLLMHGYINFGVAPAIKAVKPIETNKASVIIIGAGLAGLGAARQLMAFGHKVLVLEGRQRPGGRVYTKRMEGEGLMAFADLGGSVITGIEGNPLGVLARQLNLPLHKIRDKCPLYRPNGLPVKEDVDSKVETQFNELLDGASKWREDMEQAADSISLGATLETLRQIEGVGATNEERQLYDWHLANLEYANAGLLTKLSLAFWDQDDPYEMGGDHCFLPGGNAKLVNALAEDIPIKYGKSVHTIKYGSEGVKISVQGEETYDADMALCTVPLGVLQRGMVKFDPILPQRKLDAVKRLGFGLLNKVVMLFPKVFWGSELDMFGHLAENPNKRGEFFLFYSYALVSEGPLLLALVAGEAAIEFEKTPPLQAVMRVMTVLRGIYEPRGIEVPNPVQTVCTRWGSDYLSYGSYSNVAVGASGDDYDILAESVGDGRLFFAGEATIRRYPATMHGAYLSGLREAGNIAATTAARRAVPRGEQIRIQKDVHLYSSTLGELFREPDLEFGSISIIFDHQTSDPKSIALVRFQYGGLQKQKVSGDELMKESSNILGSEEQQFHLYTTITRQQAYELREVRGGDSGRLAYLCQKLGVKLVGRRGLGPQGDALVVAIKWHRAMKKSIAQLRPPKPLVAGTFPK